MLDEDKEIIDTPIIREGDSALLEIIKWWEKKRLYYNIIMITASVLAIQSTSFIGGIGRKSELIIVAFFNLIGANFCYSLGWGIGILKVYYFNSMSSTNSERWTLFVLGSAFSFLATFLGL